MKNRRFTVEPGTARLFLQAVHSDLWPVRTETEAARAASPLAHVEMNVAGDDGEPARIDMTDNRSEEMPPGPVATPAHGEMPNIDAEKTLPGVEFEDAGDE